MSDRRKAPKASPADERKVQLPQFGRDAQVRSESFDADANTVEIVWTTGASVRRYDWWDATEYDEVLSVAPEAVRLDRLNLGAPFLDTHCSYALDNVIGSVVPGTAKIVDGRGVATILLSKAEGAADTIQKIREGVIRNISVGYWIHKVIKTEGDDTTVARWDVVDWEPLEISAVPIPADPGSQIRSETGAQQQDGATPALRSCVLVTRSPASAPKSKAPKETPMANRTRTPAAPKSPKSAAKRLADLEAENKRLKDMVEAHRRDADGDDKDERDAEDDDSKKDEESSDDERDADGDDKDEESDDERDGDDEDEERDCEEDDAKRDAGKRGALSAAEVRKAAEAAVRKDRVRGAEIRSIAAQFGLPKLGERHANGETSVRAFKDLVLERLADRQKKRGNTTFAAAGAPELDESRSGQSPGAARDYEKGAAEARALLGKKA